MYFSYKTHIKTLSTIKKIARYSPITDWFSYIPEHILLDKNNSEDIYEPILKIVEKSFLNVDKKITPSIKNYLMEWMCQANNFLNYYLNQPLNKQNIKPKEVWFGCGGASIWNVILIEKLRRIGCTVVTHDHGSGNAHMDQKTHHWIDFLHSDRFITFNETLVKIKKNNVNKIFCLKNLFQKLNS